MVWTFPVNKTDHKGPDIEGRDAHLMKREIRLYLQDIWGSMLAIGEYIYVLEEEDFQSNSKVQDAVVRRLENICEAVKNID